MSRRVLPFLLLMGVSPLLLGKGCGDDKEDPTLPDGTTTTTGIFGTTTSTGTTTEVTTTENLDCRIAWLERAYPLGSTPSGLVDRYDVLIAGPAGESPVRLTSGGGAGGEVIRFSPDGQWIAFLEERIDRRADVYSVVKMRIDGTERQVLHDTWLAIPVWPDVLKWSPDGQWIGVVAEEYFEVQTTGGYNDLESNSEYRLLAIRADGSGQETVATQNVSEGFDWMPDGALVWADSTAQQLMRAPSPTAAGAPILSIPNVEVRSRAQLEVSPDGTMVAFASRGVLGAGVLTVAHLDGSGITQLDPELGRPEWSPDGTRLLARRRVQDSPDPQGVEFVTVDPDGTNEQVTAYVGGPNINFLVGDWNKWGPDRHVYFPQSFVANSGDVGRVSSIAEDGTGELTVVETVTEYFVNGFDVSPLCFD